MIATLALAVMAAATVHATPVAVETKTPARLYGTLNPPQLTAINEETGQISPFPAVVHAEGQADELSAIDGQRGVYYIVGYNFTTAKPNLLGLDLDTGATRTSAPLPFAESGFVGVGQTVDVDPESGDVFLSGRLTATGPHHLLRFDPRDGKHSSIVEIGGIDVLGGDSAYDPITKQALLMYGVNHSGVISIDFFAVDVANKTIKKLPETFKNGHNLESLDYDEKTGYIYGTSTKPNSSGGFERYVGYVNPAEWQFREVGSIEHYPMEYAGIAALNPKARELFLIMQEAGKTPSDPFNLLSVNIDTGKIVRAPEFCTLGVPNATMPDCPWTMEYA
eukprot:m.11184 g.11184  ORF g.11184 m.11184 type:complete len:335 (-) comp3949_c0_seq1:245-1249(-)